MLPFMPDPARARRDDVRLPPSSDSDPFDQLVEKFTRPARLSLCPELRVREATSLVPFWEEVEALAGTECEPPFWGWSWPGSQALTRFLLDDPAWVRGRDVLDLGCGNGLSCVAARMAGARCVVGNDIDPYAVRMACAHAALNGLPSATTSDDLLGEAPPFPPFDVLLIGDLFYARDLAPRVERWARQARERGAVVLIGDPDRTYAPRRGVTRLASYDVPVDPEVETVRVRRAHVLLME
jgi:predicted nicotinamide N-methyase